MWEDLTIAQKSQMMNRLRPYGMTLSEMREFVNNTSMTSPQRADPYLQYAQAPVYAAGGDKSDDDFPFTDFAEQWQQELEQNPYGLRNAERHSKSSDGTEYYDVVNMHYHGLMDAMHRRGFSKEDADRLVPFLITQLDLEGGWTTQRGDNNYGGLKINGEKGLAFDTLQDFYNTYLDTLDNRWGAHWGPELDWRNATSLEDYAGRINRDDLGLTTKEKFVEYNRKHRDNPVYLYTPEWHNGNRSLYSHFMDTYPRTDIYLQMVKEENPYIWKSPKREGLEQKLEDWEHFKKTGDLNHYAEGGSIHIKKSKRGTFTAAAKKHGKSVQGFAAQVLAHPENYSPAMVKKANFARNSKKWKHEYGGIKF